MRVSSWGAWLFAVGLAACKRTAVVDTADRTGDAGAPAKVSPDCEASDLATLRECASCPYAAGEGAAWPALAEDTCPPYERWRARHTTDPVECWAALDDRSAAVRWAAAEAWTSPTRQTEPARCRELVRRAHAEDDPGVAYLLGVALGASCVSLDAELAPLVTASEHQALRTGLLVHGTRGAAVRAAAGAVARAEHEPRELRRSAFYAWAKQLTDDECEVLLSLSHDPDAEIAAAAAHRLVDAPPGPRCADARRTWLATLTSVRHVHVVQALARLQERVDMTADEHQRARTILQQTSLEPGDPIVRIRALQVLATSDPSWAERLLRDPDPHVAREARSLVRR